MHIKVKEQEFEEGAVGYSLDVPIIRSSHLMQEIIHLGFEPNKVINMAYCALKTEYANKPMDSLQILELIDDNGKSVLEFFAKTQNDAKELIECASKMDIMALCKEHKCHYRPEYLIDGIQRGLSNSRLISWEYDSVFPFTFG